MRHFIRLLASIFGPISCSGSWGQNMAGMAVEPSTQSVIDWDQSELQPVVSLHSTVHVTTIYGIIFNIYPSRYLEFCIFLGQTVRHVSESMCVRLCVSPTMLVCVPDSCDCDRWLTQLICLIAFMCSNES